MLENTAKQCIPSLEIGDLSERKMQAVSRIPAVFLTTKNSHKVEPGGGGSNCLIQDLDLLLNTVVH